MRLLYLDWPHLCHRIEVDRAPAAAPLGELVIIGGQPWEQGVVLDCSPQARRLGVARGQPLGTAHRLVPEARFLPADRETYAQRLDEALEAISAFTPALEGKSDPDAASYGQLLLGIEGLHRLWGDERTLVGRVLAAVRPLLPGEPRTGIGNTRFGAQVAAVVGARRAADVGTRRAAVVGARRAADVGTRRAADVGARRAAERCEVIPAGDAATEAAYLAPLPIMLLPADPDARERLRAFGLARIGELAALPRSAVIARFGEHGGMLHDLARGMDGRQLRPRRPVERLRSEAELDPPVETLEPLRFVLRNLCRTLCEQLAARGAGATSATLALELDHARPIVFEQPLPEPAAAPDLLERLLLARLSAAPPPAPVARLTLELRGATVAGGQQLGLFAPQLARAAQLDWQLAGLALRFGADRLLRARIVDPEAALPERRVELTVAAVSPMSAEHDR